MYYKHFFVIEGNCIIVVITIYENLQLVIVIVMITEFEVISNCNDYIFKNNRKNTGRQ